MSNILGLALGLTVIVFLNGCAGENGQSGIKTHVSGDAGVTVTSGDVSRISPSRPVPGR